MVDEGRDVLDPFAKRRDAELDDVQPIRRRSCRNIARGDHRFEITMGGGDHAHVDGLLDGATDRPYALLLQHPQEAHCIFCGISPISSRSSVPPSVS